MRSKAKTCLYIAVSCTIFTRIISLKSTKEIWDYLKAEYEGDERIQGMQVLNLIREFELPRMKESETIKEYSDRLLNIANRVRLLGSTLYDSRIVEKTLVTVLTTLENTKDLSKITLAELLSAFQAQEQQCVMRHEEVVERALLVKHREDGRNKKIQGQNSENFAKSRKANYPPCRHCGKKGHAPFKCWGRPDAKCSKCNQQGHDAVICKAKIQQPGVGSSSC